MMTTKFQKLNSKFFANIHEFHEDELAVANEKNDKKFENYSDCDGFRIKRPFIFCENEFRELVEGADLVRDAQVTIARKIYEEIGIGPMLDRFGVNREVETFLCLDDLFNKDRMIGRFDVIPGRDGYKFCELNVDSPLCCSEDFDFMDEYFDSLKIDRAEGINSPFDDMLDLVQARCESGTLEKLIILDHSRYGIENGYFPTSFNLERILSKCNGLQIEILDENKFAKRRVNSDEIGDTTAVLRLFIYEDLEGNLTLLEDFFTNSRIFINSFVSEILTSKVWFSELWDPENIKDLNLDQRSAIKKYIPYTAKVNEQNLDFLIREKDKLVFKEVQSNSGKGVFLGKETTSESLIQKLREMDLSKIVVQQLVEHDPVKVPDSKGMVDLYNVVLGLHFSAEKYSGMLVRAGQGSGVINVGSGAGGSSWASVIGHEEIDRILDLNH